MKRFILLSLFALMSLIMTDGFSDPSLSKETSTDQVISQDEVSTSVVQLNIEQLELFTMFMPYLGSPEEVFVRSQQLPSYRYFSSLFEPPDRCLKSEYINIKFTPGAI